MARARSIKPGLYKNEDLAECSVWARYIWPGLWMLADREGRLEDRPKRIKAELLPFDNADMDKLLQELHDGGFLVRYQNEEGRFIQILKFKEHQSPHFTEKASVIDPPLDLPIEKERAKHELPEQWPPQTSRQAAASMYFMRRPGGNQAIKIGVSTNVEARLRQVRSWHGHDNVELILAVAQTAEINERTLHRRFSADRLDGEWFASTPALLELIESLKAVAIPLQRRVEAAASTGSDNPIKTGSPHPDSLVLTPSSLTPDSLQGIAGNAPKNGSRHAQADASPVVISLPLRDGSEFDVRQHFVAELEPLYPAVDVPQTLREMRGWLLTHSERLKTRRGTPAFIGKWLQGEQEKHGG